ncbi:hypothetical protein PF008_g16477 [Phytophthora fragariae]|uniref:Uncharacterized protein n=1 Tax=Phytophthora fragariae TaxID=53985 RepID=A0A6G0RC81_9STRA|nr:hypothetical protein PF003_g10904 [Phytophthora fragariae]KAE9327131.1 hypothetical protein PF008_g16477 [Phytophthora fragariae]
MRKTRASGTLCLGFTASSKIPTTATLIAEMTNSCHLGGAGSASKRSISLAKRKLQVCVLKLRAFKPNYCLFSTSSQKQRRR